MWVNKYEIQKLLGCKDCNKWCYPEKADEIRWCIYNGRYIRNDNTTNGDEQA